MYKKKDLVGMDVMHGSPGYALPEVIKDIVWEGNNQTRVIFESGFYTTISDTDLEIFVDEGEISYKRTFPDGIAHEIMRKRWNANK